MQHTFLGRAKSIAGAVFIGLGVFVLYENLDRAASQLSYLFSPSGKTLGILPTVILAALRVLQAYASDHQRFVQGLVSACVGNAVAAAARLRGNGIVAGYRPRRC